MSKYGPRTPQENATYVRELIASIHQLMNDPGRAPETSEQMKIRADRRRDMVTGLLLRGGKVKSAYQPRKRSYDAWHDEWV